MPNIFAENENLYAQLSRKQIDTESQLSKNWQPFEELGLPGRAKMAFLLISPQLQNTVNSSLMDFL